MTDELKKIIFSQQITNLFCDNNWIINEDSKNKFHSYFVDDIADYHLNIYDINDKIHFQFTLDIEIPKSIIKQVLLLINIANQNSNEGFFVFDFKFWKIKYSLYSPYCIIIRERHFHDFLKIKLDFTKSLFHNFISGIHNLVYGQKIETASLELLFLNNEGFA